jgi:hypothetical protein
LTKEKYTSEASGSLEEKNKRYKEASEELRREEEILKELEGKKNQLEEVERAEKNLKQEEEHQKHQEEAKNFEQEKEPNPPSTEEPSSSGVSSLMKEMFQNAENAVKERVGEIQSVEIKKESTNEPPSIPQVNHVNEGKSQTHQTNFQYQAKALLRNSLNKSDTFTIPPFYFIIRTILTE